jgi:RimJ/RimL family protein N-acetyltransferase
MTTLPLNPLNALLDWIPVRSLSEEDRPAMLAHLLSLNESDRYMRFGQAVGDEQIRHYVAGISLREGEVLGIFNRKLELLGLSHLADLGEGQAEFGVSVLPKARGRGFGQLLFDHACLHARARGVSELVIHTLTENAAMMAIAQRAGASIVRESGEAMARLSLPRLDVGERWLALLDDQAAEIDYRLKAGRLRMQGMLTALEAD